MKALPPRNCLGRYIRPSFPVIRWRGGPNKSLELARLSLFDPMFGEWIAPNFKIFTSIFDYREPFYGNVPQSILLANDDINAMIHSRQRS